MISIDPGKTYFGMAEFEALPLNPVGRGRLIGCGVLPRSGIKMLRRDTFALIEQPWGSKKASMSADIGDVKMAAGEYKGHFDRAEYRSCSTLPKTLRHRMALAVLDTQELALLPTTKEERGHVLCAVWQGLKHFGRL